MACRWPLEDVLGPPASTAETGRRGEGQLFVGLYLDFVLSRGLRRLQFFTVLRDLCDQCGRGLKTRVDVYFVTYLELALEPGRRGVKRELVAHLL
jgi:hypothetical protein